MLKIVISTIPAFVCAFWSILLLFEYKNHNKVKAFLGVFMLVAFSLYLGHAAYFNREYRFYSFWENIYIFCSLSVYPLYFVYLKLISKETVLKFKDFWVLIPSVLALIFSLVLYFNLSEGELDIFSKQILYRKHYFSDIKVSPVLALESFKLRLLPVIFFIQLVPIVYFGRRYIMDYNQKIRNYYSDTEGKTLQHFNRLLYIFIVTSVASGIANVLGKSFFADSLFLLLIPALLFGLLLFIIGYLGYKQEFTLESFMSDVKKDEVQFSPQRGMEPSVDLNEKNKSRLIEELNNLLVKKEIYKKNDLRITDISRILNTNRTYMSKIVNEELQTNFCDLINQYRIEHAKRLLKGDGSQTIGMSQIAELSGFKSDSSFYRIFKEKEGVSPGDFRKTCIEDSSTSV